MNTQLRPLTLSMLSADADYMYPCFKMNDVERALDRMTRKIGFHRVDTVDLPAVFTYEYDDLRLVVMTTPKMFHSDRLCYALSGLLIKSDDWATEIAPLGHNEDQDVSTWRKHPKDFYLDLLDAVADLRPDMWLPERKPKLLGPATMSVQNTASVQNTLPAKSMVRLLTCKNWQD